MQMFQELLKILELPVLLYNPYQFKTKGETLLECKNQCFMIENIEVLQDIYRFSEMGYYSTNKMLNNIKQCKSKLKSVLYQEKKKH